MIENLIWAEKHISIVQTFNAFVKNIENFKNSSSSVFLKNHI